MIQSSLLHEEYREKTSYETEDGVELRKSGVDEGVCHHVVALGHSHDTVGADMALADAREEAYETYSETYTEAEHRVVHKPLVALEQPDEECHESVETLCCRKGGENHVA